MPTNNTYDVILAGGGIMGCAIAYNLLKRDRTLRVLIIERDSTYARASTTLSDGNTRIQFNLKENIQISLYGLEVLATFAEEFATQDGKTQSSTDGAQANDQGSGQYGHGLDLRNECFHCVSPKT